MKTARFVLLALFMCPFSDSALIPPPRLNSVVLQQPSMDNGFHQDLAWSPDGSKISFSCNAEGNFEIYVMRANGTDIRNLTHNPASDRYAFWSPDGSKIAFTSNRAGGRDDIYVMNADGSHPMRMTSDSGPNSFPTWSKDGSKIAFMSKRDGHWQIYVMNADGSGQFRLTASNANDENPSFSPDGSKVIFESNRDGEGRDQLYVVSLDGSGLHRLTNDDANNVFPSWSPDGSKILYGSNRDDGENRIYISPWQEARPSRVTKAGFFARWSPHRDQIAFIAGHYPSTQIYVVNSDGSGEKKLTP